MFTSTIYDRKRNFFATFGRIYRCHRHDKKRPKSYKPNGEREVARRLRRAS